MRAVKVMLETRYSLRTSCSRVQAAAEEPAEVGPSVHGVPLCRAGNVASACQALVLLLRGLSSQCDGWFHSQASVYNQLGGDIPGRGGPGIPKVTMLPPAVPPVPKPHLTILGACPPTGARAQERGCQRPRAVTYTKNAFCPLD